MSAHTKGRLIVRGYSIYAEDGRTPVADTCLTASHPDNDHANAKRLAACWNACLPIADPENIIPRLLKLNERIPELEEKADELIGIRAQRDELLSALGRIADPRNTHFSGDAQVVAREAIAKANK